MILFINIQMHFAWYFKEYSKYSSSENSMVMHPEFLGNNRFKCYLIRKNISRKPI